LKKNILIFILVGLLGACTNSNWRTASRESAGIAVDPSKHKNALIEVYAADAFSWRGWFAVHTWIAIKPQDATEYTVYEVVGWRVRNGLPALRKYQTAIPDRYWYGSKPRKILSVHGEKANELIPQVFDAIARYPWANEYTLFPGPNSNTFPQWVGLQVPELGLELPFRAIGSGYAD
jgi:hypothetical protein